MRTLALIGAGNIGGNLARLAVAAGLDVVVSNSRSPETLADLVAELGENASAATADEAAAAGEWVVVSVPLHAYSQIPVEPLVGKTVIETTNYNAARDGHIRELDEMTLTSSELVQRHLQGANVVRAFNQIYFGHLYRLARPAGSAERGALPVAADDADAKAHATELLDLLGWDAVDAGTLAESWRFDLGTPVATLPYMSQPWDWSRPHADLVSALSEDPGRTVRTAEIGELLQQASRDDNLRRP